MRTSHTSSSLFPAMAICARDQLACSRHLSERHERAVHRGYTALGAGTPVNAYRRVCVFIYVCVCVLVRLHCMYVWI